MKQKEDVAQVNPQLYEWLRTFNAPSSINSIPENTEKVNTLDEINSKPLNDEAPIGAENVDKHSQDELEAKVSNVVNVLKISQKEKNLSIATPNLFGDMPEVLTINSIPENSEKVNTLDEKIQSP